MQSQNTINKLSRRNWLRDTAIAATGVALVPSLLTSCTDHVIPEPGGLEGTAITEAELRSAAKNINNMVAWLDHLHTLQTDYETDMFLLLQSGKAPSGWSDFVIDILLDIAVGIITAAAAEAPVIGAGIVGVFAITSELIKKFAWNDSRPDDLKGAYANFKKGQDDLYKATTDTLTLLASETDNYPNLRARWMEEFDFNGKKYTIRDLASAQFPSNKQGAEFVRLQNVAYDQFRKYFWTVMFIKAGSMNYSYFWSVRANVSPSRYARDTHYPNYPATYLRGRYNHIVDRDEFYYWYWEFDGRELSPAAAKELFKDDYPGNIINPDALFNRDYVFKQFHRKRPDFGNYHELRRDLWSYDDDERDYDHAADNYDFTAGGFPQLIDK